MTFVGCGRLTSEVSYQQEIFMTQTNKMYYEIIVKEAIDPAWSDWLQGFSIQRSEDRYTHLSGYVSDQAALYGLLNTLCNLNLTLLRVHSDME